jgi:acyl-CoA thioester hydrolase
MSEQAFTFLMRVRYAECDMQYVVFNSRYVEFIDVAATEFMRHLLDGDFEAVENQVVNVNVNWRASARFDDVLAIQVAAERIGNTSYTLAYTFHNHSTGEHLVDATVTYVAVDRENWQKTAIPADYRARLQAGLPGVVVDHAGASLMPSS